MEIVNILIGIIIGGVIVFLLVKAFSKKQNFSNTDIEELNKKLIDSEFKIRLYEEKAKTINDEKLNLTEKCDNYDKVLKELYTHNATLSTNNENITQKNKEQKNEIDNLVNLIAQKNDEINKFIIELSELKANNNSLNENIKSLNTINLQQAKSISELNEALGNAHRQISAITEKNTFLTEKLETQKTEIENIRTKSQLEFENIANKILEEKTHKFTESNKINIENILKPIGENLDKFKKQVEDTYDKESKQRFSLEEKVKDLIEMNNKLSQEANNLASALKGQTSKQGKWGEIILESILDKSGLVKDREYFVQKNEKNIDGENIRPDIIINLPDEKNIIIDSKVSLVAYDRFCSAENQEEQEINIKQHLDSIYRHIDGLSSKNYTVIPGSLDFVMMFFPIEPAYLLAIQRDQELWAYAYSKRVLLISPTNLIASLKLIADLWKREFQNKNALAIAQQGERLYDKFVGFTKTFEEIGKSISKSMSSYNDALSQLKDGRGNLVVQATKLKNLGLKTQKNIPDTFFSNEIDINNENEELPNTI